MKLVIAGGGTGGHLFPGLAVARALKALDPDSHVLFVGAKRGIEARIIPETEFDIRLITARGLKRTGFLNIVKAALEIPVGLVQSARILRRFRPDVVLGVGGYASAATVAASCLMGIPRAVQEQNSVMGAANRLLSKISNRIFISWEGTLPETDPSRTILTGNPVRAELLVNHEQNRRSDEFRVLIFGGSAGAASINRSMINAAHELRQISDRIRIRHQTGEVLAEEVKKAYDSAGLKAETHKFITDMSSAYDWADLVICRGGAGAMAEISVKGKPAIVIPYPYAVGDHQAQNASTLARHGAIRVIRDSDLKDQSLAALIIELAHAPEKLKGMAEASRTMGRPDAAEKIAKELMKMTRSPN